MLDNIIDVVIVILAIGALWKGADWVVEAASRIGKKLGMSDLVIGLTIVAFGTSAPEFAVTISAALKGQSDISVGNVVGSNIFNLGFILGGVAAIRAIQTGPKLVYRDGFFLVFITVLLRIFVQDLSFSKIEGFILVSLLLLYLGYLLWKREGMHEDEISHQEFRWLDVPMLLLGLILIIAGGHFLVDSASDLARVFGLSEWIIGVTIVAAGTSAPEFATSLVAVLKGRHGISIGNLIGSDIFNLLGVLGVAILLNPTMIVDAEAITSINLLIVMVVTVAFFMRTGWQVARWEGVTLFVFSAARWIASFTILK